MCKTSDKYIFKFKSIKKTKVRKVEVVPFNWRAQ